MTATEWAMTDEEAAQMGALLRAKPGDPGTLTREVKAVPVGDRSLLGPDPARLAAVAVLSAAGANLADLDIDAAAAAMRRELGVAACKGRSRS